MTGGHEQNPPNRPAPSQPPLGRQSTSHRTSEALRGDSKGSKTISGLSIHRLRVRAPSPSPDPETRFWAKVQKTEECWLWIGAVNAQGYGSFRYARRVGKAHRFSYEIHRGAIPAGLTLDHLCRV